MHIICESLLMTLTENYQNLSVLVKATACQSWRVFSRHSVDMNASKRSGTGEDV